MPVRFLLGPAGSGKTHHCLTELRRLERARRPGVYLVPEQFTYSADRELLSDPSLPGLRHVQVLSFSRLGYRLREEAGAPAREAIEDPVRVMLLRAVLHRLEAEALGELAAMRGRHGLLEELARFIAEVRAHGPVAFAEAVRRAVASAPEIGPSARLRALAAVFAEYDRALRDLGRCDPEEALSGLEPLIARRGPELSEWTFFVDGFLSWTRREREILVALAAAGSRLEIALCCEEPGRAHFAPVLRAREQLRSALARAGIAGEPPMLLPAARENPGRWRGGQLRRLERGLHASAPAGGAAESQAGVATRESSGQEEAAGRAEQVILHAARSPRQEVLLWARTLDRWLRLDPHPCAPQETAVILRDLGPYRDLIREVFPRYAIPVFLDERRGLLAHPRARFLLGALEVLLSGWRRDAVLSFLRNPRLPIAPAELDLLENLSLEYGLDYEAWYAAAWEPYAPGRRARFSRFQGDEGEASAEGAEATGEEAEEELEIDVENGEEVEAAGARGPWLPVAGVEAPAAATSAGDSPATAPSAWDSPAPATPGAARDESAWRREALLLCDELRRRWLFPLRAIEAAWAQAPPLGPALVADLRALEARLLPPADAADPEPEWTAQVGRNVDLLLDEAARLWPDVPVDPAEFARALRQGCASARVGVTPQRLGQVTVAEIQRSRLHGIRRAIVGGLNDGSFPRTIGDDALLGERDRRALAAAGLELGPSAGEKQEEETYFAYIALTRASERLVATWSDSGEKGEARFPSLLVEELRRALPEVEVRQPEEEPDALPALEMQSARELGDRLVAHLARTGVEEIGPPRAEPPVERAGSPAELRSEPIREGGEELLEELYKRIESGGEAGEAPAAGETPVAEEAPVAEARRRLDRARAALLYRPELRLEDGLLSRLFPSETICAGVSRLLEFARCPYRAFARRVLGLEPRPEAEVTPLETGLLAHAALEQFFRAPTSADPSAIQGRLRALFRDLEGREEFRAFFVDDASRYRWESTLRNLERFLRVELARLERSPYRPRAQEIVFGPALGNAVEIPLPEGRRLLLVGRIDRLDRREEGGDSYGAVIDYKRTERKGVAANLEKGLDLQLAAYLLFVRERLAWVPAGGFYAPVLIAPKREEEAGGDDQNPLKIKVHGIYLENEGAAIDSGSGMLVGVRGAGKQAVSRERMDELLAHGRRYLAGYADGVRSGWIEARPLEEKAGELPCGTCDFSAVCRFRRGQDPVRREPTEGLPHRSEDDPRRVEGAP